MQVSIALHLKDAKGRTQPNSDWGRTAWRDSGAIIASIGVLALGLYSCTRHDGLALTAARLSGSSGGPHLKAVPTSGCRKPPLSSPRWQDSASACTARSARNPLDE